jgi:uncharacterized membrane protein YdbT with pleckstrin-like domain
MIDVAHLPGQQPDEENIFFLRRHWFVLIPVMLGFVVILVLPFLIYGFVNVRNPAVFAERSAVTLYVLGASMFFLYAWLFLYQNFIDWYLDMWIVTNYRIVNIEQHGLFGRTMSELMLYNVQDVTSDIKGFIHTIFDYGVIHIQTAGETKRFEFEDIEHPTHVAKRVMELANEAKLKFGRDTVIPGSLPTASPGTGAMPSMKSK